MIRVCLTIVLIISFFSSRAQKVNLYLEPLLGVSHGEPIYSSIEPPDYAVDIYTKARNRTLRLKAGLGLRLNAKNVVEFYFSHTSFFLDEESLADEYKKRFPNHYIYNDLNNDETNSQGNSFSLNSFEAHYGYFIENKKMTLLPSIGLGLGIGFHRDFSYHSRSKSSNNTTEYQVKYNKKVNPTYSLDIRFGLKKAPNIFIDVALNGGPNKYIYSVKIIPHSTSEASSSSQIIFKRKTHAINVGIILIIG